jgi:hypothetical protein
MKQSNELLSIATKLKYIIKVARDYEIDTDNRLLFVDGYKYLMNDIDKLLNNIKNKRC